MIDGGTISLLAFGADLLIRIGFGVRVILRRCPVPVSLTWLLLLLFLPFASWILYLLLGEPRLGLRRAERYASLTRRIDEEAVVYWKKHNLAWVPGDHPHAPLAHLGTSVSGMPPLKGNRIEQLGTGGSVLDRIIEDINAARAHCHLLFYIWQPTGKGVAVGEALINAVARGVACRVLVDSVGARGLLASDLCRRMRAGGVQVVAALPANPLRMLFARIDLRNHRKLVVIDGSIAYCGSQNLTDETFPFRRKARTGPWIDATVRLRGPAVDAIQTVFLRDWLVDSEEPLEHPHQFFTDVASPVPDGSVVHVLPSGPGPQADTIHQAMLAMLHGAREEIIVTTPYFVPDEATKTALINAALRGVDVTLVLPDVLDARLVAAAARAHYEDLLVAGVRIVEHQEGLLHAKTATIDRQVAMVGSANFDVRSFLLNFECTLFVYDRDFAGQLRFMQRHYVSESQPVDLKTWRQRSLTRRLVDNCAQLLSPML